MFNKQKSRGDDTAELEANFEKKTKCLVAKKSTTPDTNKSV